MPGKGELLLTGQLRDVKESAMAGSATSVRSAGSAALRILNQEKTSISTFRRAVPKDGPPPGDHNSSHLL